MLSSIWYNLENLLVYLGRKNLFSDLKKEVFRHQDSLEILAELDHLTAPTTMIIGLIYSIEFDLVQ